MSYEKAWLSYRKVNNYVIPWNSRKLYCNVLGKVAETAIEELKIALGQLLELTTEVTEQETEAGICLKQEKNNELGDEGYRIFQENQKLYILAQGERGILYGCFSVIRMIQTGKNLAGIQIQEVPETSIRMMNHWDNLDGSIERGYAGLSFFFEDNKILVNHRTKMYARLAASVGINGVVINNVNVKGHALDLIEEVYAEKLKELKELFECYGIRLYLSLDYAAPMRVKGIETSDPCDERVKAWWKGKMKEIYGRLPGLGGFLIKADSEGRPGPYTYGRNHADGANMLAEAIEPYHVLIIWRCFVYNCTQDWRDKKTDRAKAGYDNFMPLDGMFRENVILQIKNGPMDFQVREPVSPLFGGLQKTNEILEVQIAQEYTGQQRHVCYLIPMFKEILKFHTYCQKEKDTVKDLVTNKKNCGMAAVSNTGSDDNWFGHDLAAANYYGFGRLAFSPEMSAEEIAKEWIQCTFGMNEKVQEKISDILMKSWPAYENYTSPLGIGWMVNRHSHYGPNVDAYEYDTWGTYHRADHCGIGVERGREGTDYVDQYHEPNASVYNDIHTCPEELLLFFHHIPYSYHLNSGKTLLQHIYDTHFEGVEEVEKMHGIWKSLKGEIDDKIYERVLERLTYQIFHAKEWRDQINSYFYRKTMIPDEKGRTIY